MYVLGKEKMHPEGVFGSPVLGEKEFSYFEPEAHQPLAEVFRLEILYGNLYELVKGIYSILTTLTHLGD